MQHIALAKVKSGMTLAQAVAHPNGPVLVGEGIVLTESIIDRIRRAGVFTVCVVGDSSGSDVPIRSLHELAKDLPLLFRRYNDNIFMMTLHSVIARHFARRIAEERSKKNATMAMDKKHLTAENGYGVEDE